MSTTESVSTTESIAGSTAVSVGRTRAGAAALLAAGVLFVLYPALRPWRDETTVSGAVASMGSQAWVAAHLFAMIGFVLLGLGLFALWGAVSRTRAESLALAAVVTTWIGAGLTLPYYGAEDFGLHALAGAAVNGPGIDVLGTVEAVRYQPVAITTFGAGLVLLGVGGVLTAAAVWRSAVLPRLGGVVFALAMVSFLPQFYLPAAGRIAHGVLVAVGCGWLAVGLLRRTPVTVRRPPETAAT